MHHIIPLGLPTIAHNFVKMKFHSMKILNDVSCNLNWIKLNSNSNSILNWIFKIQFINWIKIQLNWNGMQIGGEGIENLLITMLQCWKKKL
jgi:hypothetical protein